LDEHVSGAVVIVVLLLIMPVVIIMSMVIIAGLLGWLVKADVDSGYPEDSEYLQLGK
jgi:hypothetical protein